MPSQNRMVTGGQRLKKLLGELFGLDSLIFFIETFSGGNEFLAGLSEPQKSNVSSLAGKMISEFRKRGMLNESFFEKLLKEFPGRRRDIEEVAVLWRVPNKQKSLSGQTNATQDRTIKLFNLFVNEFRVEPLRLFVKNGRDGQQLLQSIGAKDGYKLVPLVDQYLLFLAERDRFDELFFRRLAQQRPQCVAEISEICQAWGVHLDSGKASEADTREQTGDGDTIAVLHKLLLKELVTHSSEVRHALARALGWTGGRRIKAEEVAELFRNSKMLDAVRAINQVDSDMGGMLGLMCVVLPYCFCPEDGRPWVEEPTIQVVSIATATMVEVARAHVDRRACAFKIKGDKDMPEIRSPNELGPLPNLGPDPKGDLAVGAVEEHLALRFQLDRESNRRWRREITRRMKWFVNPKNPERRSLFYVVRESEPADGGWLVAVPKLRNQFPALHFVKLSTEDLEQFDYEMDLMGPLGSILARNR